MHFVSALFKEDGGGAAQVCVSAATAVQQCIMLDAEALAKLITANTKLNAAQKLVVAIMAQLRPG